MVWWPWLPTLPPKKFRQRIQKCYFSEPNTQPQMTSVPHTDSSSAPPVVVPAGWQLFLDAYQRPFYYNPYTRQTSVSVPAPYIPPSASAPLTSPVPISTRKFHSRLGNTHSLLLDQPCLLVGRKHEIHKVECITSIIILVAPPGKIPENKLWYVVLNLCSFILLTYGKSLPHRAQFR